MSALVASSLRARYRALQLGVGGIGLLLASGYAGSLLDLEPGRWRVLVALGAGLALAGAALQSWLVRLPWDALERGLAAEPAPAELEEGITAGLELPRQTLRATAAAWACAAAALAVASLSGMGGLPIHAAAVLPAACASSGAVCALLMAFGTQRLLEPAEHALGARCDAPVRDQPTRTLSLRLRVLGCATVSGWLPALYAGLAQWHTAGLVPPLQLGWLLLWAALPLLLGHLLAAELEHVARTLGDQVRRLADAGAAPRGAALPAWLAEDELGAISRRLSRVARGARVRLERVEVAHRQLGTAADQVCVLAESLGAQIRRQLPTLAESRAPVERIEGEIRGVAESTRALGVSVEESSSSILELGAAGEQLNGTASLLSAKVEEVSSAIEQLVRSVRGVAQSTETLAAAASETSSGVEEMATSMREVDANAAETARLSGRVVAAAERGRERVSQTAQGMEAIREATETAERVIRALGARVQEIGAIVRVIDEVADDTNLLALNAAIIAAQAGEHGRSFSVVADEIKDLAERVLTSTKEIGGLIRAVQEESANAVRAIERGTKSVQRGVSLSAEAGVSLEEITGAAHQSGERMAEIVAAVREQTRAASHVAELMERLRLGVDQIRTASTDQARGNEVVSRNALAMRDVSQQVRATAQEQARGSGRLRVSIESIRDGVEQIDRALREESVACRRAVELLGRASEGLGAEDEAAARLCAAVEELKTRLRAVAAETAPPRAPQSAEVGAPARPQEEMQ